MFTGATTSVVSQGNSKHAIESLLRCKEQCNVKSVPLSCDQDKKIWDYPTVSDFEGVTQLSDSEIKIQTSPISNNENSQDSLDQQKDFNYSQKLFHIADGNLYSIFSPIQGRSYGMKPSFLRKQKYTIQESHSRGRKNLRKGLKFHNFLPSESVTSEKDSGYANAKWKVYSECRLREEHGTKQIAISNWSQSVQKPPDETYNFTNGNSVPDPQAVSKTICAESTSLLPTDNQNQPISDSLPPVNDTNDFVLNSQLFKHEQNISKHHSSKAKYSQKSLSSHSSKKDSLNILLSSLTQKPLISEKSNYLDDSDSQNRSFLKHRRKPVQTRRIVPYNKYLSIMEENETLPLDLSSKCLIESSPSHTSTSIDGMQNTSRKSGFDYPVDGISTTICDKNAKNLISNYIFENKTFSVPNVSSDKVFHNEVSSEGMQNSSSVAVLYPFPVTKNFNLSEQNSPYPPSPPLLGLNSSVVEDKQKHNMQTFSVNRSSTAANTPQFSVQKSVVKEVQSKPRRRNQRSVMKQKLEDTFRQNGFLVKTKQVSDGEATFCKFRQLRKCTRYYLKSLEQHLPDEFHKMLKGFLPPKTVLPPVLGAPSPANEP